MKLRYFQHTAMVLALASCATHSRTAFALGEPLHVTFTATAASFPLTDSNRTTPLYIDANDYPGVIHAVANFTDDIHAVTNLTPTTLHTLPTTGDQDLILIGTIGHSTAIDALIATHKLDVSTIRGHWEMSLTQIVDNPFPGIARALVIAGADKRGTIFGIYDLSEQIGVSPWAWWADVPIPHHDSLYLTPGTYIQPEPRVKYRGIFLNDEAPALSGWTKEKFGGFNSKFYVHVFDLLLRLKANFLWPAMWGSAFNEDDTLNPKLADEYGIVMGTSHHEPMMRAQQEWKRHGNGTWDYTTNQKALDDFWRQGVRRNKNYEQLTTIGMRGDGDMAMSAGTNTALLERIVADQRKILTEEVNPDITKVPQVWALYKEVQSYYEAGMRVPDDVTLLWCDDNWGNIRRLPTPAERKRPGGAGIYYHFDYVGDPRSYKWINTYNISKVYEQMNLAINYGADRMWIVNVGDLKPMEFPIEFFLNMARTPDHFTPDNLHAYTVEWATRDFGPDHAEEIASIFDLYQRYISRRKPEMLAPDTFSLENFNEANRVDKEWVVLTNREVLLQRKIPANQQAAFFELLGYPIFAAANDVHLYLEAGRNAYYAKQGWAAANKFNADDRLREDAQLSATYNHLLNGKWNHMMDQTHIGYTFWNEPPKNTTPPHITLNVPEHGGFGVNTQIASSKAPTLGTFIEGDETSKHIFTLFNKGSAPLPYTITTSAPWISITRLWEPVAPGTKYNPISSSTLEGSEALVAQIDWKTAPVHDTTASITLASSGQPAITLPLQLIHPHVGAVTVPIALESNGYVAIEAAHTSSITADPSIHWHELPNYGPTLSGMTLFPVTATSNPHSEASLNYAVDLYDKGDFTLHLTTAPTLNFVPGRGLRLAVSIDNGPRKVIDTLAHNTDHDWRISVADGVRHIEVPLTISTPGQHMLHIFAVDPGIVLERLDLAHGALPYSYLGPPESATILPAGNTP